MTKYCWAPKCKENWKSETVSFHSFPKNLYQRQLWIKATGRSDEPRKTLVLCSKHFRPTDFDRTAKRIRLKDNVIPQFENIPEEQPNNLAANAAEATPLPPKPMHLEDAEDTKRSVVSKKRKAIKWQPKHITQVTFEHLSSPANRVRYWSQAIREITMLRKKVKILQEYNRRYVKRINNFKCIYYIR